MIVEGRHYKKLSSKFRNKPEIIKFRANDKDKIQVLVFFSYACFWCSKINRPLDEWAKSDKKKVKVYFVPVGFNRAYKSLAKAYFTAEKLDSTGKIDDAIFDGLHKHRINYSRVDLLEKVFEKNGIKKELFLETYNSFDVAMKVSKANELTEAYNISATPNIIINCAKESYITNLVYTGNVGMLLTTLDFLIKNKN